VLDKQKLKDNIDCIMEEVAILNQLDHPNIVKYYETYDDSKYIYLVMEFINGFQLFEMITAQENQTFTEEIAAGYMKSLFQAINHCHAIDVIHRDIKPENIMITKGGQVRLIDFGLSKASKKKNLSTVAGTPYYMAPEVLEGSYGAKADIWSLGVLLYTLVSGYLPFQGNNSHEVFRKIKEAEFHFSHQEFNSVSDNCKDLIKKLLVVNVKKRLTGQ
jgi:calcium-dependent protein kinase